MHCSQLAAPFIDMYPFLTSMSKDISYLIKIYKPLNVLDRKHFNFTLQIPTHDINMSL